MCGIAGIVGAAGSATGPAPQMRLQAMLDAQRHRGPDGEGTYRSPSGAAILPRSRVAVWPGIRHANHGNRCPVRVPA